MNYNFSGAFDEPLHGGDVDWGSSDGMIESGGGAKRREDDRRCGSLKRSI